MCAVSGEHNENAATPYYWFALHQSQLDFLDAAPMAWVCFGCGSAKQTLVVPVAVLKSALSQMSVTANGDRRYWHVVIQRKVGKLVLRLLGAVDGPDLTTF